MPPIHIKSSVLKIERSEWSAFVANHPSGNAFQAPEIYDIFKQIKDYTPIVLGAFDDQEKLAGILLAVIQKEHAGIIGRFTARTIVWGGPLVSASAEEPGKVAGLLVDALIGQTAKKSVYIEFRNLAESRWYNAFSGSGFQYLPYINAILPLEGKSMEKILSGMKYNRRREIRISVEEGATYGEAQSSQEVRSLYKILHDLYRKRVKVPLPPYEMFEAIFKSHAGKIFVVKHGDRVIGGAACLLFAQKTLYTLYYCGKRDYHPRIFPTHLAIVAAIRYCLENGFQTIDFMGAGKSNVEYGVRKYKAEFGCILPEYGRYLKINNPFIYRLGKFWISTKKHYSRS